MPSLPEPVPDDPLPLVERWLADAADGERKNPWAMALATVGAGGGPSVRFVLLKHLSVTEGFIVFYTNYGSRKAIELDARGAAAAVLYWPDLGRQLRLEGRVERSPENESDAYFAARTRLSQLNAWASRQSAPIGSVGAMDQRLDRQRQRFVDVEQIPRPGHWGGYRLHIESVELWLEGSDRFHQRVQYRRRDAKRWSHEYLQP